MNKKYLRKIVSLGLTVLMTATMFTGCSGDGNKKTSTEGKDLNGRVITIAMSSGTSMFTDSADGIYKECFDEIAEKYNVQFKIVTVPQVELEHQVELDALAHTSTYDVVSIWGYNVVPTKSLSGQFLCMSDYYDFNDGVWDTSEMSDVGTFEGKRYGLPIGFPGNTSLFYNKKLVKAANLEDPWTYVEKGTWNWDTFKEFAKALTIDKNGDGEPEQFGMANENPYLQFVLSNNASVIDMTSGHGQFAMDSDNAKKALEFVQGLYDEKIIPTDQQIKNLGMGSAFNAMATGKAAMFTYNAEYAVSLAEKGMDVEDIGWVYFPKGPDATDYVAPNFTTQDCFMIPAYVENPEDLVLVMQDAMAYWSPEHKSAMTVDEIREKNASRDDIVDFLQGNHLKMYKDLADKSVCINSLNYPEAYTLIKEMLAGIQSKKYTVQAGLHAYKSAIQQAITDHETVE